MTSLITMAPLWHTELLACLLKDHRWAVHRRLNGSSTFHLIITARELNAGRQRPPLISGPTRTAFKPVVKENPPDCVKAAVLTDLVIIWEKQVAPPAAPAGATEQHKLERAPRLPSSKQHCGSRDPNTNSLITLLKLFVDISSQSHSSFKSSVQLCSLVGWWAEKKNNNNKWRKENYRWWYINSQKTAELKAAAGKTTVIGAARLIIWIRWAG